MAKSKQSPGRTLIYFFVFVAIMYGLVALAGNWKPRLGLDLQGGTQITMLDEDSPTQESLEEARSIIDQRVNGSGISEAEVYTEGGNLIVVALPGEQDRSLIETVERQAQLRFRLVACSDFDPCSVNPQTPIVPPDGATPETTPAPEETGGNNGGNNNGGNNNGGNNRPPVGYSADQETEPPADEPTDASPTEEPTDGGQTDQGEEGDVESVDPNAVAEVDPELAWARSPDPAGVELYNSFQCNEDGELLDLEGEPATVIDDPTQPLVACSPPSGDPDSTTFVPASKYLLSKSLINGTDLTDADFGIPQGEVQYVVTLSIGGEGRDAFTQISQALVGTGEQFAIVLDGRVISAPTMEGQITDGRAQISGDFSEAEAQSLSTSLKFGALPLSFEEVRPEIVGPSLAGDQLSAGVTAGLIGLILVLLYCMVYYRGLGIVVVASLLMAALITYGLVVLLSESAGLAITLAGIAGFIIAVGVTADSFIILFERIRDEMRDGKTMRVAVESGWTRARNTCLAADAVSLLAALVLYIFATGPVKGFAFALGLSTLVDLMVFFWFTKPMVSWLGQFTFFNTGHRFSGLSADALGVDALPAGGKA